MTRKSLQKRHGFTKIELLVVIAIFLVLGLLALPELARARGTASRIRCVSHLKQIGTAYRVWAGDNGDLFPSQSTNGWANLLTNANQGINCWTNYIIMANELGQSPQILVCPSDERIPAATLLPDQSNGLRNINISYFVGASASDSYPQSILGGDRNLGPGPKPGNDYGFSPASGAGNDVVISTNSAVSPLVWSLKMHPARYPAGAGNILLGDGSVQQCSSVRFQQDYQPNAGSLPSDADVSKTSFRLIFP